MSDKTITTKPEAKSLGSASQKREAYKAIEKVAHHVSNQLSGNGLIRLEDAGIERLEAALRWAYDLGSTNAGLKKERKI